MVVGIDEVGRGALAGPVVVGAVTLEGVDAEALLVELLAQTHLKQLRDSKKLSRPQRERVFLFLERRIEWGIGQAEPGEIDQLGLAPALKLAAGRAIDALSHRPDHILADAGLRHSYEAEILTERFVKGDEYILEITLASVMAKVWRDRVMGELALHYPDHGFNRNCGYGTEEHIKNIRTFGKVDQHRKAFVRKFI